MSLYRNDRLTQFSTAERKMFNSPKIMGLVPDYIRACDGHNFAIAPCRMTYSQIPVGGLSICWHKTNESPWTRQSILKNGLKHNYGGKRESMFFSTNCPQDNTYLSVLNSDYTYWDEQRYINVMPNIAYNFKVHQPSTPFCIDIGKGP